MKKFFEKIKKYLVENKGSITKSLYFSISLLFLLTSCPFVFSNTKLCIQETIAEKVFNNINNNECMGIIYGHENFENTFEIASIEPEKSKEMRSLQLADSVYDVYPSNFLGSTPAVVQYKERQSVPISFLLLPKGGYLDSFFSTGYSFKLLVGRTDNKVNVEDIYINQQYADYLIYENTEYSSYNDLVGKKVVLPAYYNDGLSSDFIYNIRGVIDESDEKYSFYKEYIGDFFLVNQYLSMPLRSCTIFELKNKITEIKKQINCVFSVYKYESNVKRFNATELMLTHEYRLLTFDKKNSINNITAIEENNEYFKNYHEIYDYFLYKNNIFPLLISSIMVLISLVMSLILFIKALNFSKENRLNLAPIIFLIVVAFGLSVLLSNLFSLMFLKTPYRSIALWESFLTMFLMCIIFVASALVWRFKQNNEKK